MNKKPIALFFGGKVSRHLGMIKKAARKEEVELDLISYNRVTFETNGKDTMAMIRGVGEKEGEKVEVSKYGVLFFRTTGKHWEEVNLIINSIPSCAKATEGRVGPVIVDPIVESGKPDMACKAWQMVKLSRVGIPVPKTVYGSLGYLFDCMGTIINNQETITKKQTRSKFQFPVILKGSGGDRGTRVFKANSMADLEKLTKELRRSEIKEGKRYMLEEYIENKGDFRVLVLGDRVLGVMKRTAGGKDFRNNYSMGGKVEVADLPEEIKKMAVEAARACGLMVAGVDVMPRNRDKSQEIRTKNEEGKMSEKREDYVVLEVNKGPQFSGFMKATGIDVPREIVRFLAGLGKV